MIEDREKKINATMKKGERRTYQERRADERRKHDIVWEMAETETKD